MKAMTHIDGIAAVIPHENIDTDQIIPAAHLSTTQKNGLGQHLFSNWRYDSQGNQRSDFVLNQSPTNRCKVLISGDNFGCGSSREHAPWALLDFGIEAVISTSIADIFRNNAIKNGLLPMVVSEGDHQMLMSRSGQTVSIDIESQTIKTAEKSLHFELEPFARYCFLNGMDQLDFLLSNQNEIAVFESQQVRFSS